MATVMISFLAGLFVGEGKFEEIKDNLDLERGHSERLTGDARLCGACSAANGLSQRSGF